MTPPRKEEKNNDTADTKKREKQNSKWNRFVKKFTQGTLEFVGQITEDEGDDNNDEN